MSDTTRMLDSTTDKLLAAHVEASRKTPARTELLAAMREAGLALALAPEEADGYGCAWSEAAVIAYQWGRHAAPLPIVQMLLAARIAGEIGAPALAERATAGLVSETASECRLPVVTGCDRALALVRDGARPRVVVAEVGTENLTTDISGQTWGRVSLRDAENVVDLAPESATEIVAGGCLLSAAAISGALSQVMATIIEYAGTRKQFGRPLAKFQAIQHMLADAAAEALASEAAVVAALRALDEHTVTPLDWLSAKAQAGRAAGIVSKHAHQVMGAIGFTEEHSLHHYSKRLWTWRDDWLPQSQCELEIGHLAFAAGGEGLWPMIVDRQRPAAN